jgi:peptidoglycan/LPS O-acetylase OafA/YrhL
VSTRVVPAAAAALPAPRRVALLDGLRLVAALSVLLFHYLSLEPGYWGRSAGRLAGLRACADYGWLGVDLFFLISGFVICSSSWGRRVGEFAVSRIVRIYPAYLFAVGLTATVLRLLRGPRPFLPLPQVLANLTMFQALLRVPDLDGPYWTLSRELLFYLCFALAVWRGLTYRRAVAFCLLWTLVMLVAPAAPGLPAGLFANAGSTPYFAAGITFSLLHRFGPTLLLYALLALELLLAEYGLASQAHGYADVLKRPVRWSVAAPLVVACFLVMLLVSVTGLGRIEHRWLTWAGGLTYPLYLIHQGIGLDVIVRLSPALPAYPLLAALVAAMLAAAALIHAGERRLAPHLRRGLATGLAAMRAGTPLAGQENGSPARQRADRARSPAAVGEDLGGEVVHRAAVGVET